MSGRFGESIKTLKLRYFEWSGLVFFQYGVIKFEKIEQVFLYQVFHPGNSVVKQLMDGC